MFDFTALLPYIGQLAMVAVVVEALTEAIKRALPDSVDAKLSGNTKQFIALAVSVIFFAAVPLRISDITSANVLANLIAMFAVSRGSNYVHDLAKLIQEAADNIGKQ